jgi:hypothetical protein
VGKKLKMEIIDKHIIHFYYEPLETRIKEEDVLIVPIEIKVEEEDVLQEYYRREREKYEYYNID